MRDNRNPDHPDNHEDDNRFLTVEEYTRNVSVRRRKLIAKIMLLAQCGVPVVCPSIPRDELLLYYNILIARLCNGFFDGAPDGSVSPTYVHEACRQAAATLKAGGRPKLSGPSLLPSRIMRRGRSNRGPGTWFMPDGVTVDATDADSVLRATDCKSIGDNNA